MACTCWTDYESFETSCTEPDIIYFHIKESTFTEQDRGKKRLALREFDKRVSALRNTEGGVLFIHITDRTKNNSNLSGFDQFVDKSLKSLIADGCSFVESYSRKWFCPKKGILILTVAKGSCVSSVSLNTKVCSDHEIEFPSTFELKRFVSKEQSEVSEAAVTPEKRHFHQNCQDWVEDRHIELKTFHEPAFLTYCEGHKHNSWEENFVSYIWNNLRFQEYLTCMSKVPGGGSFYVGISEWKKQVVPDIHGIPLRTPKKIEELFKQKLTTVTVYSFDDTFKSGQEEENIIEIKFHDQRTGKSVLELAVKCVQGIVFYDNGPLAYKIGDENHIVKVDKVQWMRKVRSWRLK